MRAYPLIALLLVSCASAPKIEVPKTVEVEVPKFVPLDDELTKDCLDEAPKNQQLGEAVRLANTRHEYLAECTARMRRIRELQPKVTP
jgi:hypothetical protein